MVRIKKYQMSMIPNLNFKYIDPSQFESFYLLSSLTTNVGGFPPTFGGFCPESLLKITTELGSVNNEILTRNPIWLAGKMLICLLRKFWISTEPWLLACQLCDCFFPVNLSETGLKSWFSHLNVDMIFCHSKTQCPPRGASLLSQKV